MTVQKKQDWLLLSHSPSLLFSISMYSNTFFFVCGLACVSFGIGIAIVIVIVAGAIY